MERARIAIVGRGRLGSALAHALPLAQGPFGRGFDGRGFDIVVLAVPDGAISDAVSLIVDGPLVGHCSGITGLGALGNREAFGLHPLMTVTMDGADFAGCTAAVGGTSERARRTAADLATELGMVPFEIADDDRAAYHAAASIASNFLVTLEDAAEQVLRTTGNDRAVLVPLVRAAVENWATLGGRRAITGPIARGDGATVELQRDAIAARTPELLALFDAMRDATAALVARKE